MILSTIQRHFEQQGGTYLLVGTLATVAGSIHSRWGGVATFCFTATAVGSGFYLRKRISLLSHYLLSAKVSALFSMFIPLIAIISPTAGFCLGAVMGGSALLRDWNRVFLLEESKGLIQQLTEQNKQLGKTAQEQEGEMLELRNKVERSVAIAKRVEAMVSMHTKTQEGLADADADVGDQFDRLEAQVEQLFLLCNLAKVPEDDAAKNIGLQMRHITQSCQEEQQAIKSERENIRELTATCRDLLSKVKNKADEKSP